MDRPRALSAARRLLKSSVRLHIIQALVTEKGDRWTPMVELGQGIQQDAQEDWNKIQPSWAFDDLASIVDEAMPEATAASKEAFIEVVDGEWLDTQIALFLKQFSFLSFLERAKGGEA